MYQQKGRTSWHGSQPGMMMTFHGSSVPLGTCWLFSILIATNPSLGSCTKNKDSQHQNQTCECPPRTETREPEKGHGKRYMYLHVSYPCITWHITSTDWADHNLYHSWLRCWSLPKKGFQSPVSIWGEPSNSPGSLDSFLWPPCHHGNHRCSFTGKPTPLSLKSRSPRCLSKESVPQRTGGMQIYI